MRDTGIGDRRLAIGDRTYRIGAEQRDGRWTARAGRDDTGDAFGVEATGESEEEAIDRLKRWLQWQHYHTEALDALQAAERAYHRAIAGSAFASPTEGPSAIELQKEALDALEAARTRLDTIRAQRPETNQAG
jgi:hypothetical protein